MPRGQDICAIAYPLPLQSLEAQFGPVELAGVLENHPFAPVAGRLYQLQSRRHVLTHVPIAAK
jgi:hypothetical protein